MTRQELKQTLDGAAELHRLGRIAEAEPLYRRVLDAAPRHADALHLLGLALHQSGTGSANEAVDLVRRAITERPNIPDFYSNLARMLEKLGRTDEARRVNEQRRQLEEWLRQYGDLPADFRDYQLGVERKRLSPYLDYPREVTIETLALCNAACEFCPYPDLERQGTRMSDDLVEKILSDLEDIPRDVRFSISPFKVSDPLLDTRIFDIIERAAARLPHATVRMFTNGSPLTPRHIERFAAAPNIEHLWISLNHHEPEGYERIMKLPWKKTRAKLDLLHDAKTAGRFPLPVIVSRVCDGSQDDRAFEPWVRETFPLFQPKLVPRTNWLGRVDLPALFPETPPVACDRWFELSITATGVVALCCMDGRAEFPVGDVSKQHVLEVYNAPEFRRLREQQATRKGYPPLRNLLKPVDIRLYPTSGKSPRDRFTAHGSRFTAKPAASSTLRATASPAPGCKPRRGKTAPTSPRPGRVNAALRAPYPASCGTG